jgi:hypothetical protein
MLLSVGEVLKADDFKSPVFLLKGYDADSIVLEGTPRVQFGTIPRPGL